MPQKKNSFVSLLVLGSHMIATTLLFSLTPTLKAESQTPPDIPVAALPASGSIPADLYNLAQQITVRIFADQSVGSGVIIRRSGQTYTLITNAHVIGTVAGDTANATLHERISILTADGQRHSAQPMSSRQWQHLDLAVLQFNSSQSYPVVEVKTGQRLQVGETVIAAGFPNWQLTTTNQLTDTRPWGNQAFQLTQGRIGMLPSQVLAEGYQLGYTNEIKSGMSGGPVLNQQGQLIGINGRSKFPLSGVKAFQYMDGTYPSTEQVEQMQTLSWGIPHSIIRQLLSVIGY
jgi:S1-C subfamily serine protease